MQTATCSVHDIMSFISFVHDYDALESSHLIFFFLKTVNPTGCQCPVYYVLDVHCRCVRSGHSYVNPSSCTCPVNYQLNPNLHYKCECVSSNSCSSGLVWNRDDCKCGQPTWPMCSDCHGISELRDGCICL